MQVDGVLSAVPANRRFGARMAGRARLSHLDAAGRARMVDVGEKPVTTRVAVAGATVLMRAATLRLIAKGAMPKGDVLAVARLAGIMAAKRTAELIPLCHPLQLSHVDVQLTPRSGRARVEVEASVRLDGRTGAEMEALTAASVAALTIYDMCKAVDRDIEITAVRLLRKEGGKSGRWVRGGRPNRT
jgi:cyclic pyranopterin phosphate synthase